MGDDHSIISTPMTSSSPTVVSSPSQADEAWGPHSLSANGTAQELLISVLHQAQSPHSPAVGSYSLASEEMDPAKTKSGGFEEQERVFDSYEQDLKHEDSLDDPSTAAAMAALQAEFSDEAFQRLEQTPAIQLQEAALMVVKSDEVPVIGDVQHTTQEVVLKQEVAHRSQIFSSLKELDENSARQLLNDSGWNVSQNVRKGGKAQWYYRSPPPKPVLLGSLTSAVTKWKKSMDEDYKRKGGGSDDPYPLVTAFLNNVKKPTAKNGKRGRPY